MTTPITHVAPRTVQPLVGSGGSAPAAAGGAAAFLPAPSMSVEAANGDVMTLLYALTSKQRDTDTSQRGQSAQRKNDERKNEYEQMKAQIAAAKEAEEDGGWLDSVTDALDAVCDCVVGGNPLQDLAHSLSEATGIKAFEIVYDFVRPDALLHAAACLATEATGCEEISQVYDLKPLEAPKAPAAGLMGDGAGSSLKSRFQAAADLSGTPDVMEAYGVTRAVIASAMVTVGTCGTGTVAMVAVATSGALMVESKADLLGKAGVGDKEKMWMRLGAQAAMVIGTAGVSMVSGAQTVAVGAKAATNIVNGANQVSRGAVDVGKAVYAREVSAHNIEAAKHEGAQGRIDRQQQRLVTGLREVSQSYQRTLENLAGTMKDGQDTRLMLARQIA
jgi:hypothetical protein